MKLFLLPGLDGTGLLFRQFIKRLPNTIEPVIVSLPETGDQSTTALARAIKAELPEKEPYFLLGESFSGRIAFEIARNAADNLRGLFFVASFLTRPAKAAIPVFPATPVKALLKFPILSALAKSWMTGNRQADDEWNDILVALGKTDNQTLLKRMSALKTLKKPSHTCDLPSLHIVPTQDKLVDERTSGSIAHYCASLDRQTIEGPHFILQTHPKECAKVVSDFLKKCK